MTSIPYVHGYSPRETVRLGDQAQTLSDLLHHDEHYPAGARVLEAVAKTGAAGPKDLGKVMGAVMAQVKGRADGTMVSRLVRESLGG